MIDQLRDRLKPGGYIEIPPGWESLVLNCDERLARIDPKYQIVQIKEKFGGLRYYTNESIKAELLIAFQDVIKQTEDKSFQLCRQCGAVGSLVTIHHWYFTLCPRHIIECQERRRW